MKQHLPLYAKLSAIVVGCFLFCNTIIANPPCSIVYTDTTVSIPCGNSVTVGSNTYDSTGTYADTLTASSGCDSVVNLTLTVGAAPTSTFTATSPLCPGQNSTITYTGTANGSPTYTWNFAGGTVASGTGQGPYTVNWATGGTDTVTLLVTSNGCTSETSTAFVVVNPVYQTNLYDTICQGNSFGFKDSLFIISGKYYETLTSSGGCDSVVTLNLEVLPQPLEPYIVQQNNSLVSSIGDAYQWYLNDTVIVGDTTSSISPTQSGYYQVEITGSNGCKTISAYFLYPVSGIQTVSSILNVAVYPNPNNGNFTVQFADNSTRQVAVTNVLGQTILPAIKVTTQHEFDLSAFAAGIYFLKITDGTNTSLVVFKQVVVQH